jgi:predicted unusual protein kinase regulating ubiquinone biosynthesis (AarF/ABC1/UbiB family)
VSDIPKWAISRSVKLASLPLGVAGRGAIGLGKRIGGRPAEIVATELQQRTAEQLFKVLGELKGGAMKFGQALSVFEAALPEDLAAPYRAALTKLQDAAPPMPASAVHQVLAEGLGADWRDRFAEWNDKPAAAASIGQVHRARWEDGREVAVKLQYPGAGPALIADLNQLARFARMFAVLSPGLDVKPLIKELRERVKEELDYGLEAVAQRQYAEAYDGDADFIVPKVLECSGNVIVTEWVDGKPLSGIIRDGSPQERNHAALLFARFLLSGPSRAGLLHADPHPGNFRLHEDGRLVVLDYVQPLLEPIASETFHFTRRWLRNEAARVADPRSPAAQLGRKLNLPPTYLLMHRVAAGSFGVLCQLDAEIPYGPEVRRWIPGLAG